MYLIHCIYIRVFANGMIHAQSAKAGPPPPDVRLVEEEYAALDALRIAGRPQPSPDGHLSRLLDLACFCTAVFVTSGQAQPPPA